MSDYIPFDIQQQILLRLPVRSLLIFRKVCKEWKSVIDSVSFQHKYGVRTSGEPYMIVRYKQGHPSYIVAVESLVNVTQINTVVNNSYLLPVGSSEGIWCYSYSIPATVCFLWNPSIHRSIIIPVPAFRKCPINNKVVLGFGVNPDTLDPTIVKVSYPRLGLGTWKVVVFTMSSMVWKNLELESLPRETIRFKRKSQVVVGRLIIWAGHERFLNDEDVLCKQQLLVSFDLVEHVFRVINIDVVFRDGLCLPLWISSIGNCLVLSSTREESESCLFCGWSVQVEGTTPTTFSLLFAISTPTPVRLLGFTRDEIPQPIVEVPGPNRSAHSVQLYNINTQSLVNLGIEGDAGKFFIGPYKESLLLLPYPDGQTYYQVLAGLND